MSVGSYYIPPSLRSRPGINQILKFYPYYRETENEYKSYLEKEAAFKSKYQAEYAKLVREYKPEKPLNPSNLRTDLYRALCERQSSSSYVDAVYEFYFLFRLSEEYDLLERQSKNQKQHISATVGANQQPAVPKTRVSNFAATVYTPGRQQSVDSAFPQNHNNVKIIEEENAGLKVLVDRQGQDIILLQKAKRDNERVIDELRNRLSGFASKQLTEGNPNFTDLSDKNRPTRIAENFHAVYDDEWTNALEVLSATKKGNLTEEQAIHKLMNLVKEIYKFCCSTATDQTLNIVMNILKPFAIDTQPGGKDDGKVFRSDLEPKVKLLRREYCMEPIANITEKFKRTSEEFKTMQKYPEVIRYTEKCTELFWLMRTVDPPMVLKWPERGEALNVTLYNHYNKKGDKVSYAVWPAVLLHEGGAVMYKGFAKPQ
ncbi:uncharacterized protein LOC127714130 [Mytilus californianus]|uniref:uncharacterized protein LOC127714130 n=1 Tax=Mytilus californianus TaxID=6549 RepID=UPI0022466C3C|nr:uncharacterized protein LOC127714130 [Mytilus californianus]XP_052076063.1 uncharacterized protein LOC127714130 [Mytilus californianus]